MPIQYTPLEQARLEKIYRLREEGIRGEVYLFKNNTDSAGNSYGCHENYLVERDGDFAKFTDVLIPFLVTRQVYAGAGKVLAIAADSTWRWQMSRVTDENYYRRFWANAIRYVARSGGRLAHVAEQLPALADGLLVVPPVRAAAAVPHYPRRGADDRPRTVGASGTADGGRDRQPVGKDHRGRRRRTGLRRRQEDLGAKGVRHRRHDRRQAERNSIRSPVGRR